MTKPLLIILIILNCSAVFSQDAADSVGRYYEKLGITLTIQWDSTGIQYLTVHEKDGRIKLMKLNDAPDLHSFDKDYLDERKICIIRGRREFYIFNLLSRVLTGPITPELKGDGDQSGMLADFNFFNDGQYLMVCVVDFGIHCFNVTDSYHPREIDGYVSDDFPYHYFFLDKRSGNSYNGIVSATENGWEITDTAFLFKGYHFQEKEPGKGIMKKNIEDRYLLLMRAKEKSTAYEPFVIDYQEGKILNAESDKKLILRLSK